MDRRAHHRLRASLAAICALVALSGCASREQRLAEARDLTLAYFANEVERIEGGWSVVFGYLYRRFGVVAQVADGRTLHDAREGVVPPEIFRVFRRLVDPDARVSVHEIAGLGSPIDRISASAIHCRDVPLPENWVDVLYQATRKGAYALTHAVAAAQWTLENGCRDEMQLVALHAEQVRALEVLLADRGALATRHRAADDIWIEALAMLYYADAADRVKPAWLDTLIGLQRGDGGFGAHPRAHESDPHASALALWVVLEALEPDAPRVSWIPHTDSR